MLRCVYHKHPVRHVGDDVVLFSEGGMRTTVGTVGKLDVEHLGVVGACFIPAPTACLGSGPWSSTAGRFYRVGGSSVIGM